MTITSNSPRYTLREAHRDCRALGISLSKRGGRYRLAPQCQTAARAERAWNELQAEYTGKLADVFLTALRIHRHAERLRWRDAR